MNRLASSLACLGLLAPVLTATSIDFVGTESGTEVGNWSNTAVAKTQDLNGDDRFGGAGYYQITPGAVGDTWSQAAPVDNNLGISQEYPTQYLAPTFLSGNPLGAEGTYLNLDVSPAFSNPAVTGTVRQGALWLSSDNQTEGTVPGDVFGTRISAFNFTMSSSVTCRVGVAVDTLSADYISYSPDRVSVWNVNTGEVFSGQLARDGTPDMVFFDIDGSAGDVFEVALWQTDGDLGIGERTAFSLITFDQIPDPPTPTLVCSQNGSNFTLSWEPEISGWVLESSTNLGATGPWQQVPGVVNNSVILDMTGVPKNFFRLRKDP